MIQVLERPKSFGERIAGGLAQAGQSLGPFAQMSFQSKMQQEAKQKELAQRMELGEKYEKQFKDLGFTVEPLTKEIKKTFDVKNGVFVKDVERYSIASERGLFPQCVIVKADRKMVKSPQDLKKIISGKSPGDAILLQIKLKDANQIVALEIPEG